MRDYLKIINENFKDINYRTGEDYIIFSPYFLFPESHNGIAIMIREDELGRPILSDCHTTLDYLDYMEIDLNLFQEKFEKIKNRYGFLLEERTIKMTVPTDQDDYFIKYLGYLIQAISLIANIDIWKNIWIF